MKIILATSSVYRIRAFRFLGIPFIAEGSSIDESLYLRNDPRTLVKKLAAAKAQTVAEKQHSAIVLGFDSVGYFNHMILEKPKSKGEAFIRLRELSGKTHDFYTGVYGVNTDSKKSTATVAVTQVTIRSLSDQDITNYLEESDNYLSMAVGFSALDHYSASFVSKLVGSSNNLIHGIPLELIPKMLEGLGWQLTRKGAKPVPDGTGQS